MSDDIVERLRSMSPQLDMLQCETVLQAADEIERLRGALQEIFAVGDGYGPNTVEKPAGTTGEGHARCRALAEKALDANTAIEG